MGANRYPGYQANADKSRYLEVSCIRESANHTMAIRRQGRRADISLAEDETSLASRYQLLLTVLHCSICFSSRAGASR